MRQKEILLQTCRLVPVCRRSSLRQICAGQVKLCSRLAAYQYATETVCGRYLPQKSGILYSLQHDYRRPTDNQIGNLCSDFNCSTVLHTFSKLHNFLISYPILLNFFWIGLSDFSASIESKLFLEWTWPLNKMFLLPEMKKLDPQSLCRNHHEGNVGESPGL